MTQVTGLSIGIPFSDSERVALGQLIWGLPGRATWFARLRSPVTVEARTIHDPPSQRSAERPCMSEGFMVEVAIW